MDLFTLTNIFSFFLSILIFFSIVGLGNLINNKFLKINSINYYEGFITGIFFVIFYLQIHILFFPIDFYKSILFLGLLIYGFIYSLKSLSMKISYKLIISLVLCFLLILNSSIFPYYNSIFDYGLYHNTYLNWLNQSNITLGLANLHYRFGYTGSSYLLGAFFNFYPYLNNGYVLTTSIFYIFLIFFFINNFDTDKNDFLNFYNLFILYVILKYILVESLGDVSPSKIIFCLLIYIFYNLIKNYHLKFENNYLNILLVTSILITLSPSTWFISILIITYMFFRKFLKVRNFKIIIILGLILCCNYALLNFLKSGNIFYPIIFPVIETKFTIYNDYALYHIKNFPKGYPEGLEWILPKFKEIFFQNNFAIIYGSLLVSIFITSITRYRKIIFQKKDFFDLKIIIIISLLFWFFLAPDIRFGKSYFWIGLTLILSFYFSLFYNKKYMIYLIFFVFLYCITSSVDNLTINRNKINRVKAINNFIIKQTYKISETNYINVRDFNYTFEKLSVKTLPENISNLIYKEKYFSIIYFKK